MSLINWLRDKPTPRFYACSRAAYGISSEHEQPVDGSFGLLHFDKTRPSDDLWEPFGESRFIVPQEVRPSFKVNPNVIPGSTRDPWIPHQVRNDNWPSMVQQALEQIRTGYLEKVVLAQRQVLTCPTPIDPLKLLERLQNYFPEAHHFYYEPKPGLAFLGASPERLYKRTDRKIETEAQAGTRLCGQELSQELLKSPKDHHEHQIVVDNILNALSKLCIDYGITEPKHIVTLPNVQHLKTKLAGILKNAVSDQDILETLHPTAAVCGWPLGKAFEIIRNLENFDRGFYAGAFGYVDKNESEFNVAIRSAVIQDNKLYAFAGAGLVSGSTAENEEQEITNKMAFWEKLL